MRYPDPPSSSRLVERACNGDTASLGKVLLMMREDFKLTVHRLVGPALRALVEPDDLFQEASLQAMKSIGTLRAQDLGGVRNWFFGIVRNRVFNIANAARVRMRPHLLSPLPDAHLSFRDPSSVPDAITLTGNLQPPNTRDLTREEARDLLARYRIAMVLRNIFASKWSTVAYIMLRDSRRSARTTHQRATHRLRAGVASEDVPTYP